MLRRVNEFIGYKLAANDGEIGKAKDMYFDDRSWAIRYLVVDTGGWLKDRKVVIPRTVMGEPDWATRRFNVKLSRQQVEDSPPISQHEPVSRRHEKSLHEYLRIEPYWVLAAPGGGFAFAENAASAKKSKTGSSSDDLEPHLRSFVEVSGYHIQAHDGEIGQVEDFVVDDDEWYIQYLVVDIHNLLPGKKVLVEVPRIEQIDWAASKVHLDLTCKQIKEAPEFDAGAPVNRRREEIYYDYDGRPT